MQQQKADLITFKSNILKVQIKTFSLTLNLSYPCCLKQLHISFIHLFMNGSSLKLSHLD